MTAKNFIDSVIADTELIVTERPYHAFALLCSEIEILGKCLNSEPWHTKRKVKRDFFNAINTLPELNKYKRYNSKTSGGKDNNKLYDTLRCGIIHAGFPKDGSIKLINEYNDLNMDIIGCRELYDDIKKAWNNLKNNSTLCRKNLSEEVMNISGAVSASTGTNTILP